MTRIALQSAGMMGGGEEWSGKYGVHSAAEFLANPEAQEKALSDFLNDTERQLRANGSFRYIGKQIDGQRGVFPVTTAGLVAAAHRQGAPATRNYLERIEGNGFRSRGANLTLPELHIETRLRTFSRASYE